MKNTTCFLSIFSIIILFGCSTDKVTENESLSNDALEGSWQLISRINHGAGDTTWSSLPDNMIYQKHITPTNFTWLGYDKEEHRTTGTGGGTYTFSGDTYMEDINFFYPPGSDILGQTIPFSVEMKDGKWYHTGYSKDLEFDAETGDMKVVDSTKIEEIWERVETHGFQDNTDLSLAGSWELVSYMPANQQVWTEYPDFVGYIKHVTPSHFLVLKYNKEGDEITFELSGTYNLNEDTYIENILTAYPSNPAQIGTSHTFKKEMRDDKWYLSGFTYTMGIDSVSGNSVVLDSTLIQEIWQPYGGNPAL
jgi:hypothetical protein